MQRLTTGPLLTFCCTTDGGTFLQCHVHVPLATALARNAGRKGTEVIPEDVITRMAERLEVARDSGFEAGRSVVLDAQRCVRGMLMDCCRPA